MRKILVLVVIMALSGIILGQGIDNLAPKSGPDIGLKRVGIRGGAAIPFAKYNTGLGMNLIADLGDLVPVVGLEIEVEYVKTEEKDPREGISPIQFTAIGGGIKGIFKPKVDWALKPYAGVGLGMNILFRDYPKETADEDESETRLFEPRLDFGFDYPLNDDFDGNFSVRNVLSNPSYATIMIGLKYKL